MVANLFVANVDQICSRFPGITERNLYNGAQTKRGGRPFADGWGLKFFDYIPMGS